MNDYLCLFEDPGLSYKAKGIAISLLLLGYSNSVRGFISMNICRDGRDSTYSGFRELIRQDYLKYTPQVDESGRSIGAEYVFKAKCRFKKAVIVH